MKSTPLQWAIVFAGLMFGVVACGTDPDGASSSPTEPTPPPPDFHTTTSVASATSHPPPAGSGTEPAMLPSAAEYLVTSDDGIFLDRGKGGVAQLWDRPTAHGFMIGSDLVVAQASIVDAVYPRRASGPILVFDETGMRPVPIDAGELRLLDAGVVTGRRVALMVARAGTSPETADERLLLVDLESEEATDLGSVGGWESGVSQARLAGDRVVLLREGEGLRHVAVVPLAGGESWTKQVEADGWVALTIRDSEIVLVESGFAGSEFVPVVTLHRYDLATGSPLGSERIEVVEGATIEGGFCFTAEWMSTALLCDQAYGGPLLVDLDAEAVSTFDNFHRGVATTPRNGASP